MNAGETTPEEIGVREFARRVEVSASAVSQAVKAGRIKTNENGKLDWPAVLEDWENNRVRGGSGVSADDYYLHRAETELWRAKTLELEYEVKAGSLIPREDAERDTFRLGRILRDNVFAVPARVAPIVAAESDERTCYNLLIGEQRAALESVLSIPEDRETYLNALFTPADCIEYLSNNPKAAAEVLAGLTAAQAQRPRRKVAKKKAAKKKAARKSRRA